MVYVAHDGRTWGPYDTASLQQHVNDRKFLPTDLANVVGSDNWQPLNTIASFPVEAQEVVVYQQKEKKTACLTWCIFLFVILLVIGFIASTDTNSSTTISRKTSTTDNIQPKLELLDWNWSQQSSFVIVEGQVKNISSQPLENVKAVVEFYTATDVFISSDSSLIEYKTLMPGQTSPFKIIESWNPQMKRAKINFTTLFGRQISWKKK